MSNSIASGVGSEYLVLTVNVLAGTVPTSLAGSAERFVLIERMWEREPAIAATLRLHRRGLGGAKPGGDHNVGAIY